MALAAISPGTAKPAPHRFTREQYLLMGNAGIFDERECELLDGEIYEKGSANRPHRIATRRANRALRAVFGADYDVSPEVELPLGPRSQPKPDVSVLRGDLNGFDLRDEGPEDTALLMEIVDSREDTAFAKRGLYARAGIPEYWILDVNARTLTVHREPGDGQYAVVLVFGEGERVRPLEAVEGGEVAVADLLSVPRG